MTLRTSVYAYCAVVCAASGVLTWLVRRAVLKHGIIDEPNERSSHSRPVPRGGGLAIVFAASLAVAAATFAGAVDAHLASALLVGGAAVAWVGFSDDRKLVAVWLRLLIHAASAVWAVWALGGLPLLQVGERLVDLGVTGNVLGAVAIVWTLNLFNFMDGIDGIAASEAVFVAACGAALSGFGAAAMSVSYASLALAAAAAGFLPWNWPPARVFMGDVGSGYLGYFIAVLALAAGRDNPVLLWVWLILGGVFFMDATITLVRRAWRGERAHVAHRSHAYQWLARRWGSHLRVTACALLLNVLWLLPCAAIAARHARYAVWMLGVAFLPLGVLLALAGSGRRETSSA